MHWKDTLIKSSRIKWNPCKPKNNDDGKLDFDLHIPLTDLFEDQAKESFAAGLQAMFEFYSGLIQKGEQVSLLQFANFYDDCGYLELAKDIKTMVAETTQIENTKEE